MTESVVGSWVGPYRVALNRLERVYLERGIFP